MKFSLIVPTRNPGDGWVKWIEAIKCQDFQPQSVLVVDSESDDDTVSTSYEAGFSVLVIPVSEFNHGATRQMAIRHCPGMDVYVFLTQDAILADSQALKNIINAFTDPEIGMAYGRQLPRRHAGLLEAHARYYNYPAVSAIRSLQDKETLGMKSVFASNSFAAYRASALRDAGGFPSDTIVSEDMYVAAKMLAKGWKIAYCADSKVYHSHGYGVFQEFQRYFDIGVFNARESWIRRDYGSAESEGGKYVKSEIRYLLKHNPFLIPQAIFRSFLKLFGYRLGVNEGKIPEAIKYLLSMQKGYWKSGK